MPNPSPSNLRFKEGDVISVTDRAGNLLGIGKALQERGWTGHANFDILTHVGAVRAFNLNSVSVEVIYSEPSEADKHSQILVEYIDKAAETMDREALRVLAERAYKLGQKSNGN